MRFELTLEVWKTAVLPLTLRQQFKLVSGDGFEPHSSLGAVNSPSQRHAIPDKKLVPDGGIEPP